MALDPALLASLRMRLGDTDSSNEVFSDAELEILYNEALVLYPSSTGLAYQQTIVAGFEVLLADSAKQVTYKANQSSENLSDISKVLEKLLKYHQGKLADMETTAAGSPIRYGALRRRADRAKDIPNA